VMEAQGQKRQKIVEPTLSTDLRTVLVVEDFDETRFMLKVSLEMSGYHVVEATNGIEAVEVARRERPDLILMDIGLPLMDGFAATRTIRAEADLAHVPIVAVSAHATAEYKVKAVSAGCNEYVTKPVDLVRLGNLVKHLMSH
jgi:two-component system cell cycle response regulator DivK